MSPKDPTPEDSISRIAQEANVEHASEGTPYLTLPVDPSLTSTPIYLTPIYPTDVTTLQSALSNTSLASKLINVPQPYTLADAEFWVNLQLSSSPTRNLPLQVIRCTYPDSTGRLIGCASLSPLPSQTPTPDSTGVTSTKGIEYELGYYLLPEWSGKGIMKAAVRAIIRWGKEAHDANPVIRVDEGNARSRRVVEAMEGWERVEGRDAWVDWPEQKGGGRRKFLFWRWKF